MAARKLLANLSDLAYRIARQDTPQIESQRNYRVTVPLPGATSHLGNPIRQTFPCAQVAAIRRFATHRPEQINAHGMTLPKTVSSKEPRLDWRFPSSPFLLTFLARKQQDAAARWIFHPEER